MRIGIDAQTTLGEKTGFGFYVDSLTQALQKIAGDDQFSLFYPGQEADLSMPQRFWWDQVALPSKATKAHIDLLHQPAFSVPVLYPGRKVVTIHDVISLFYTDIPFFSRQFYSKWMPFSYHFADHFITSSEHTRRDVMSRLNIPADKITVVYLAASEEYRHAVTRQELDRVARTYHLNAPYILNVGTINPRKNLEFLVRVFAEVKHNHHIPHQLVITGKKGWHYDQLFKLVHDLGLTEDVIFTGYVEDGDKSALYHGADLFVFPSLYEGFGLPPLEAMSCGIPTISSNTSSLPEVIGEGGITLSPHDEALWVKAMTQVLTDKTLHTELGQKAKKQAKQFSWERCARETLAVYHKIGQAND